MQEQKISKGPTKIVDELTVSDDFNTGLTGVPVFTDGHISKYDQKLIIWKVPNWKT